MWKITVKGLAGESNIDDKRKLDGVDCQDCFSEYFRRKYGNDDGQQSLIDKGVKGGYMRFKFVDNQLYVYVEYTSKEKLNESEIEILKKYTSGQMSDGIGENFEQEACMYDENKEEIFVSPWYPGQKLTVIQVEK